MPPKKGTKQRRGEARRAQILEVAEKIMARDGYRGLSLTAVAEEIGISAPGVLHHFESKDVLLAAVIEKQDAHYAAFWESIRADSDVPVLKRLPEVVRAVAGDVGFWRLWNVLVRENLDPSAPAHDLFVERYRQYRACIVRLLKEGQRRGEIRPNVDVHAKAAEVVAFEDGMLTQWMLDPKRVPIVEMYERYTDDLVRDLAAAGNEPSPARAPSHRKRQRRGASAADRATA